MDRRTVSPCCRGALVATACGGGDDVAGAPRRRPRATPRRRRAPALAEAPKRPGEILVQGEASPASHGPFALDGRYIARFEQIAPEDPNLDFAGQTAFVAVARPHSRSRRAPARSRLFRAAARTGRHEVTAARAVLHRRAASATSPTRSASRPSAAG